MTDNNAIIAEGLVKRFRRELLERNYGTWKSLLLKPMTRTRKQDWLTVLNGIDFTVKPASTLAIIGRNGSGKSTLLKMMAGIYKPDQGRLQVRGRISSLIELGAGFHPEFTGRENVFLNGAILGLSKKEIEARFDHIVAYSGLGDFIDAPVRTYSSGMYVRLGFSVAVNVDPDVLLVDEVLAVGDEAFAHKCEDKINEFRRRGKTICLVTHDMSAVSKYADEVIWLDEGRIAAQGEPKRVIDAYRQKVALAEDQERTQEDEPAKDMSRWGDGTVLIASAKIKDATGEIRGVFNSGESCTIEMEYEQIAPSDDLVFGVALHNGAGVLCCGTNTHISQVHWGDKIPLKGKVSFKISRLDLVQGSYFVDVAAHAKDGRAYDYIKQAASFAVRSPFGEEGVFKPPYTWTISQD